MLGETLRRAVRPESPPRRLLPRYRRAAAVLLAACAAAAVGLAVYLAASSRPAWPDPSLDPRIQTAMGHFPALLQWLPNIGTLGPVTLMTLALIAACAATRNWPGAVLAGVAEPVAVGLTEYVLKPYVGGALGQGFPSGHATSMFALAAICAVLLAASAHPGRALSAVLILLALLLAAAVAAAMVAVRAHTFTDVVGGAAVGTGVVLACALTLDRVIGQAYRRL
ncbi:MAG: phosphatase PAP2 family protein [Streptosporangiaceae bacterium]